MWDYIHPFKPNTMKGVKGCNEGKPNAAILGD